MREKTFVCTGIFLILMILLCSWALFRVEALAYGPAEPEGSGGPLPNFVYNPECIQSSPLLGVKHFSSGLVLPGDLSGAAEAASAVIRGRVTEVYYTFADGQAWTQANIQVLDCLKGGLSGSICVYFQGGYASAEDFGARYGGGEGREGFYRVVADGVKLPAEGQESYFFLKAPPEGSALPEGAWVLACGSASVLAPEPDGLIRASSGSCYTDEQLRELVG